MDSFRRSLTFGEADKKRSAFSKQRESQMEQPLLNVSASSEENKRQSYQGATSSYDSSFDVEVQVVLFIFLWKRDTIFQAPSWTSVDFIAPNFFLSTLRLRKTPFGVLKKPK